MTPRKAGTILSRNWTHSSPRVRNMLMIASTTAPWWDTNEWSWRIWRSELMTTVAKYSLLEGVKPVIISEMSVVCVDSRRRLFSGTRSCICFGVGQQEAHAQRGRGTYLVLVGIKGAENANDLGSC